MENIVGFIILGEFRSFWLYLNIFIQYIHGGLGARVREKGRQHIPLSFNRRLYLRYWTLYRWRRFLQKVISYLNFLFALFSISLFCFQMQCLQSIDTVVQSVYYNNNGTTSQYRGAPLVKRATLFYAKIVIFYLQITRNRSGLHLIKNWLIDIFPRWKNILLDWAWANHATTNKGPPLDKGGDE